MFPPLIKPIILHVSNALEFTATFVGNSQMAYFLYNKQNNTLMFGNMKLFLVLNRISHSFALLNTLVNTRNKFHISAHSCIIALFTEHCTSRRITKKTFTLHLSIVSHLFSIWLALVMPCKANECEVSSSRWCKSKQRCLESVSRLGVRGHTH